MSSTALFIAYIFIKPSIFLKNLKVDQDSAGLSQLSSGQWGTPKAVVSSEACWQAFSADFLKTPRPQITTQTLTANYESVVLP